MNPKAPYRSALLLGIVLLLYAATAHAWSEKIRISATIHGHVFDQIEITTLGCALHVGLYFNAPESAFREKKPVRNHYRFRARIDFADHSFKTGTFGNDRSGRRRFRYVHDSAGEGCWAKQPQKLRRVHVDGCRNRGCKVPSVD
jgi:hypothetical protein